MKTKKMKVLYSSRTSQRDFHWGPPNKETQTPKISMEGKWLAALGFHIGDAIEVAYEDNCIRITPAPQPLMVCEEAVSYEMEGKTRKRK